MKLIKNRPKADPAACTAATRPKGFMHSSRGVSLAQCALYDELRANVPIIDACIKKLVRLIGGFRVECKDKAVGEELDAFLKNVPVGSVGRGIDCFIGQYADSLMTYGTAIGEIVTSDRFGRVRGLYNADIKELDLQETESGMGIKIRVKGKNEFIENPELVTVSALSPTPVCPLGNSLISGLPFVSGVLMKIFDCIGTNFDRLGNLRFAVTYKPTENGIFPESAENCAEQIAKEWSAAMNDSDSVKDFVAVGDVSVKVIGADNQMIDTNIPVRQMLEQIIAKFGLPPFLLGLSWSTTERMSVQQTDILTTELCYYRSILTPVIEKVCREYLRREGLITDLEVVWDNISLQDEVELARARLYNAQADALVGGKGETN